MAFFAKAKDAAAACFNVGMNIPMQRDAKQELKLLFHSFISFNKGKHSIISGICYRRKIPVSSQ